MREVKIRPDDRDSFKPTLALENLEDGMCLSLGELRLKVQEDLFFAQTLLLKCIWVSVYGMDGNGITQPVFFHDPLEAEYWLRFGKLFCPVNLYQ